MPRATAAAYALLPPRRIAGSHFSRRYQHSSRSLTFTVCESCTLLSAREPSSPRPRFLIEKFGETCTGASTSSPHPHPPSAAAAAAATTTLCGPAFTTSSSFSSSFSYCLLSHSYAAAAACLPACLPVCLPPPHYSSSLLLLLLLLQPRRGLPILRASSPSSPWLKK